MPDKYVFEYAVIRVVPRVEREEFINVGIIVFVKSQKFLQCRYHIPLEKLKIVCPDLDIEDVSKNLESFARICDGDKNAGPIALLDAPSRFRWLTATRSTVVQSSKVHPGLCYDGVRTVEKLFNSLVL
jgi:hypothetical protein